MKPKRELVQQILVISFFVVKINCRIYQNESHVRSVRQISGCVLPEHPKFGQWAIYNYKLPIYPSPGDTISVDTVLHLSCRSGYKLQGDVTPVCINGTWTSSIGKCLKKCESIYTTPLMTVSCSYNGRELDNCLDPIDKTKAKFECADYYEDESLKRNLIHICYNGRWSNKLPDCRPRCGEKATPQNPTLIVGGYEVIRGSYPWQIALYNASNKEFLCGGTLLNQKVIVTAAHCITDESGTLRSTETYVVAAGKYYRQYDHPEDFNEADFSAVHQMFVPKQYRGYVQNYFGDIGIIITKKILKLSDRIQPICVDWTMRFQQILLDPSRRNQTFVAGWGYTVEHKSPSPILKDLAVPIISYSKCEKQIGDDYKKYLTDDKLCAGYLNASTAVCRGDSGGGLVSIYRNKYYIVGIVSISPLAYTAEGGCNSQKYALYTKFSYYLDGFIVDYEALYRPTFTNECDIDSDCNSLEDNSTSPTSVIKINGNCLLPKKPPNGNYSILGGSKNLLSIKNVPSQTVLKLTCNTKFKLIGNETITCRQGKWNSSFGICLKPVRTSLMSVSQKYSTNAKIQISCSVDGYPSPQVNWYKDGIPIIATNRTQISNKQLTILRATKADSGIYQCEGANAYSKSSSNLSILVNEIDPNCTDNDFFANCVLIVKAGHCSHKYYGKYCCRSCTKAGLLPNDGSLNNKTTSQ